MPSTNTFNLDWCKVLSFAKFNLCVCISTKKIFDIEQEFYLYNSKEKFHIPSLPELQLALHVVQL